MALLNFHTIFKVVSCILGLSTRRHSASENYCTFPLQSSVRGKRGDWFK